MTQKNTFALKGDICFSKNSRELVTLKDGYVVCRGGVSLGVFKDLPPFCDSGCVEDYSGHLIIPGLTDLHVHAPQYALRGFGMSMELVDWLNTNAFPEETKFSNLDYAAKAYSVFAEDMKRSPNTRACIFATIHRESTELLMEILESTGLDVMVGKVNMDRNAPQNLSEKDAKTSAEDTSEWIRNTAAKFENVKPIITPRFVPSCTDELMASLGNISREYNIPVQSHLSENEGECRWVKSLHPESKFYGDVYDKYGLFGEYTKTIMAHCVLSSPEETALMKERGVYIAHCPQSNTNLSSGAAPVRRYLDMGMNIGLGSDVAGGSSLSIMRAMVDAIQASKLRWRLKDQELAPLTIQEAFYMGTIGGGAFFGKVGSFEEDYEFDAVVIDEQNMRTPLNLTIEERLERTVYLSDNSAVIGKFVKGKKLF